MCAVYCKCNELGLQQNTDHVYMLTGSWPCNKFAHSSDCPHTRKLKKVEFRYGLRQSLTLSWFPLLLYEFHSTQLLAFRVKLFWKAHSQIKIRPPAVSLQDVHIHYFETPPYQIWLKSVQLMWQLLKETYLLRWGFTRIGAEEDIWA
jgi:hypothetical protein